MGKRDATIAVKEERREAEPPRLTLAQAWLHRDKAVETLLRRGTELGVTRFLFFRGQHSERAPKHSAKWERLAMDVCKQCGRNWLPAFEIAEDMEAALAAMSGTALVATAECEAAPLAGQVHGDVPVGVLVGPEGDFSPEELHFALAAGHNPLSLGATTFRAEVAGIVAATLVQYERGLLGPR